MWGGLGMILLRKDERKCDLEVNQSQKKLYNIAYRKSAHYLKDKAPIVYHVFGFFKKVKIYTTIRINKYLLKSSK